MGAAISSFQAFAHEVFDLPTLPLGSHRLIPEAVPRAQWIPDSAIRRAIRWIEEEKAGDPLLRQVCALIIQLAFAAPFRLSELLWLRLSNISQLSDGSLEIEITALGGIFRLKSGAATRRVTIRDSSVISRLNEHLQRRDADGAPVDALLFAGTNNDSTPYRAHAVHTTLLRLLKQATGDAAMTFHALRHTFISNAMESLLSSSSISNCNRLTQLADSVGHAVAVTTIKFYAHWFEFALRTQIDACLSDHHLSNADGERMLGVKANTLTATARRKDVSVSDWIWRIAEQRAALLERDLPTAAAGLDLHEPKAISFVGPLSRNFTISHCLQVLSNISKNIDFVLIQHRAHISAENLLALDKAAVNVARDLYAARGMLLPETVTSARAVIAHFNLNFDRANQSRYRLLRESLALPQDATLVADASNTWVQIWTTGYLSADPPKRLIPLLLFLRANNVGAESLLVTVESDASDPAGAVELREAIVETSTAVFHDHLPIVVLPRSRLGRARAYLVWPSRGEVGNAGRSNAGFNALMFAVAIWSRPEVQEWQ